MKKVIVILIVYALFAFLFCFGFSFFYGNIPLLVDGFKSTYRCTRAFDWFLRLLPVILLTGFVVGFSVQWQNASNDCVRRFSPSMMERFKKVIISGIVVVFILSMNHEVFLPSVDAKLKNLKDSPRELSRNIYLCQEYINNVKPQIAFQYAEQALKIAPKDETVLALYKKSKDEMDVYNSKIEKKQVEVEKLETPLQNIYNGYTIKELIVKSKEAALEKKWFDAHYWATLAAKACNGTDTNFSEAVNSANYAWNKLSEPEIFDNSKDRDYYELKRKGYISLNQGDYLNAYYIFLSLTSSMYSSYNDPDVQRFLDLAKEKIETMYFFIDEVSDIKKMESLRDIYFSLKKADGSVDVIYMKGIVNLNQDGGFVRYVDGLVIASYLSDGKFKKSVQVPFAKIISQNTDNMDSATKTEMGINKNWKSIPLLILQSIDRKTEGIICKPVISYSVSGLPDNIIKELGFVSEVENELDFNEVESELFDKSESSNVMLLPMSFFDFELINDASKGPSQMSFISLNRFLTKCQKFGYSYELYLSNFVSRGTYPIFILIIIIALAVFAWNYRVEEGELFKFSWIGVIPFFTLIIYIVYSGLYYILTVLNYVLIGLYHQNALFAAYCIYTFIFICYSILFFSRKK